MKKLIFAAIFLLFASQALAVDLVKDLSDAAYEGDVSAIKYLLKKKVSPNSTIRIEKLHGSYTYNWTPLMAAAQENHLEAVNVLLKAGAKANAINSDGTNALWIALNHTNIQIAEALVNAGASLNTAYEGITALMYAVQTGDYAVVEFLIKHKANLNQKSDSKVNALFYALNTEHYIIADVLLDYNAEPNCQNSQGLSPLMLAVEKDKPELVAKLLAHGANRSLRNEDGETALDIAKAEKNSAIVELLSK